MDMRPQAHEIIRTWLFDTLVRATQIDGSVPWRTAAISGFIRDPDRRKMGKSIGNVVTPIEPLIEYGSDAVRYWAAAGRPGVDAIYDTNRMRVGRRLAMKILNIGRFVLSFPPGADFPPSAWTPIDRAMLATLDGVIAEATAALDAFDYAHALARIETFFWTFCDDYVELVKARAYAGDRAAVTALNTALERLLCLFAPFLPYVTEEVWSWWRDGSVHLAGWPSLAPASPGGGDPAAAHPAIPDPLFVAATELLSAVRRTKKMRDEVDVVMIPADAPGADRLAEIAADLCAAAHAGEVRLI
jgi:valyl-tRNA synthetase